MVLITVYIVTWIGGCVKFSSWIMDNGRDRTFAGSCPEWITYLVLIVSEIKREVWMVVWRVMGESFISSSCCCCWWWISMVDLFHDPAKILRWRRTNSIAMNCYGGMNAELIFPSIYTSDWVYERHLGPWCSETQFLVALCWVFLVGKWLLFLILLLHFTVIISSLLCRCKH